MLRALVVVPAACLALAGCMSADRAAEPAVSRAIDAHPVPQAETFDGWTIAVSVDADDLGPLRVSVGPVEAAPGNDARPWVTHELVFENLGDRPLQFADTRTSRFIGPPGHRALLAADEGCGYGKPSGSAVEAGVCALYLDAMRIRAHSSASRTITLFKDLRKMPLVEGTYVFEKPIRYTAGTSIPQEGTGREVVLRIVYEIAHGRGS